MMKVMERTIKINGVFLEMTIPGIPMLKTHHRND